MARAVRESARDPLPMMTLVSQALQPTPNLVVREFGWRYGLTDVQKGGGAESAPSSAPQAPGAAPPQRKQSAYIGGEIRPFRGDYRGAIDTINAFAQRLRGHPAVAEVRLTKMPLDVSSKAVLSGTTLDARPSAGSAEFELVVVLKPLV